MERPGRPGGLASFSSGGLVLGQRRGNQTWSAAHGTQLGAHLLRRPHAATVS